MKNIFLINKILCGILILVLVFPYLPVCAENTAAATFYRKDETTKGDWIGKYGTLGYFLPYGGTAAQSGSHYNSAEPENITKLPDYISVKRVSYSPVAVSENPSSNGNALKMPDGKSRKLWNVYDYVSIDYKFEISERKPLIFSCYFANTKVSIDDAWSVELWSDEQLLDSLVTKSNGVGQYLSFFVEGNFTIKIKKLNDSQSSVSGFFFDSMDNESPVDLKANSDKNKPLSINLNWKNQNSDRSIRVERKCISDEKYNEIAILDAGTTSYIDDTVDPARIYYYRIRSVLNMSVSQPTEVKRIVTQPFNKSRVVFERNSMSVDKLGKTSKIKLIVKDAFGNRLEGMDVTVQLKGDFVGKYIKADVANGKTDSRGILSFEFTPEYSGKYLLVARVANDDQKRIAGAIGEMSLDVETQKKTPPSISNFSLAVKPGYLVRLSGTDLTKGQTEIIGEYYKGNELPNEPSVGYIKFKIAQENENNNNIVFQLPDDIKPGMYVVWAKNKYGYSKPILLNGPQAVWISEYQAWEGQTIKLVGKNFNSEEYGDASMIPQVRLTNEKGTYAVKVSHYNPYAIDFVIDSGIPCDTYKVQMRTHSQGSWVDLQTYQTLTILQKGKDPLGVGLAWMDTYNWDNRLNVVDYGAKPDDGKDDTAAFKAAIKMAHDSSGGVVFIPNGVWDITNLDIPADIVLLGENMQSTILQCISKNTNDIFIKSIADGTTKGHQGFARFTIRPKSKENWKNGKVTFWLGENWGESRKKQKRDASMFFFHEVDCNPIYDGTAMNSALVVLGQERYSVTNSKIGFFATTYLNEYANVKNNEFRYYNGHNHLMTMFNVFEKNDIKAYPDVLPRPTDTHGLSVRQYSYVAENISQDTGSRDGHTNDGEGFLTESPGMDLDYGNVLKADGLNLEVSAVKKTQIADIKTGFGKVFVFIAYGRGLGQLRELRDIKDNVYTIDKPWDVVPDYTSRFNLCIPNQEITFYKNVSIGNGGPSFTLYGQSINCVIADNTARMSGGMPITGFSLPSQMRYNPIFFNTLTRNYLEDTFWKGRISEGINAALNLSGVIGLSDGSIWITPNFGNDIVGNKIAKVAQNSEAGGWYMGNNTGYHEYQNTTDDVTNIIFQRNTTQGLPVPFKVASLGVGYLSMKDNKFIDNGSEPDLALAHDVVLLGSNNENGYGTSNFGGSGYSLDVDVN